MLRPLRDHVVLIGEEHPTIGRIHRPDSARLPSTRGVVMAVGPGRIPEGGDTPRPVGVKVGDHVLIIEGAGAKVRDDDGTEYILVPEAAVLAVFESGEGESEH